MRFLCFAAGKKCELNCLARGEKFYYRHASKVVDGTPCGLNTQDVCVDGQCQVLTGSQSNPMC